MPFFSRHHPSVQKDRMPYEAFRVTAQVWKEGDHFFGYKLCMGSGEEWAWRFTWSELAPRRMARNAVSLIDADPIAVHSLFGHMPKADEDMLRMGLIAERAPVRYAPPIDGAVYWEINHEMSYGTPEWHAHQIEVNVAGAQRMRRCLDGARNKLGDQTLWRLAENLEIADPKDLLVWAQTAAPFIDDQMAFQDPDKFAVLGTKPVNRRFLQTLSVLKLMRYEVFATPPARWTIDEWAAHLKWMRQFHRMD